MLWMVPTGPEYEVDSERAPNITPDEVTPFAELDADAQQEFLDTQGEETVRSYEEPALANYTRYVRYEGTLYEVYIGVISDIFRSFFLRIIGGGVAGIGVVGLGGRLLWRWTSG